jgi:hypothetical protein
MRIWLVENDPDDLVGLLLKLEPMRRRDSLRVMHTEHEFRVALGTVVEDPPNVTRVQISCLTRFPTLRTLGIADSEPERASEYRPRPK